MSDIASLSLEVKSDQVKDAVATLNSLPPAASAAEKAAQRWGTATSAAARSADDFSKRVQRTIQDLTFQREQLARTATEQERFTALRRAGVSASSAEGQAISASVAALQAQKAALGQTSVAAQAFAAAWEKVKSIATVAVLLEIGRRLLEMGKAAIEAVGGLDELAEQAGISTRALQALQFTAVQNGVSLEQLDTGIAKFSQKIGEAATGSKPMIDALDQLGVKILGANGKLRPTEDILQNVAKAILAIDDPAKRAAASVDFFGKAGTKFMPVLAEMAKGTEAMAMAADAAGVMVGDVIVKRLDAFSDAAARGALRTRDWAGTFAAFVLLGMDTAVASLKHGAEAFANWLDIEAMLAPLKALGPRITAFVDESAAEGARWSAMFVEAFASMPEQLGKLFVDAWNAAKVASADGLNSLTAWLASNAPAWMGLTGTNVQAGITPGGGFSAGQPEVGARVLAAGQAAADRMLQAQQQAQLASTLAGQGGVQSRGAVRTGTFAPPATVGTGNPAAKGAGDAAAKEAENQAKAYAKLSDQLEQTAKAQDLMTAASAKGGVTFDAVKIHLEAQQKTLEIYGKVLDDTDPKLRKIEDLLTRIANGKAAEAFNVATTELEKQNVILQAQIDLMNQAPEIQAREIALIKAKQEAEKAGTAVTQDMIDARTKAIEQNETLKIQQEELKKAQDLWTAPLKQALQDIQKTAADAFEEILTSGNFSFQALGDTFKKIIIRMAAEFLALATVRPVMSVILNAVSPDMARQMGVSSSGSGGALGTSGSGGGLGSLLGGGSGGTGGGIGDMFSNMFTVPQAGPLQPGAAALEGTSVFNPSMGLQMGSFGMGNVAGGVGLGMGALGLATDKKPTTASTIGHVGQMVGGALMMIPTPWTMAAGAVISLASSILPSLFGGTPEPPTNQAQGSLNFGSRGFFTTGVANGPDANSTALQGQLGTAGQNIQAIFTLLGGVKDASKVFGMNLQSFQKGDFSNQTSFIVGPDGSQKQWGQGSTEADVGLATGSAQVALQSLLAGAVGDITDNMRKALTDLNDAGGPATLEALGQTVTEVKAFDDAIAALGITVDPMTAALQQVDASFQALYDTASKYGFSTAAIDAAKLTAEQKLGTDFGKSITDQLLDPTTKALNDIGDERTALLKNNSALMGVQGYVDQAQNIEALYWKKRNEIMDQANAAALAAQEQAAAAQMQINSDLINSITSSVSTIEDLIRKLTPGGDLANVDPSSQLAGLRASAAASFAQAMADPSNQALIAKEVADAQAFAETSLRFNAGGSAYVSDQQMILAQQQALQAANTQAGIGQATDPDVKNLLQQLLGAVSESTNDNSQRDADMAVVISLLTRFLANGRTAA